MRESTERAIVWAFIKAGLLLLYFGWPLALAGSTKNHLLFALSVVLFVVWVPVAIFLLRLVKRTPQRQAYMDAYSGKIHDAETHRTWRCNHDHASEASAIRCADAMEDSISRLGWEEATGGFWTYG